MVRQAHHDTQVVILSLSKDAPIFIFLCETPFHDSSLIFWNETELHFREYLDLEANPTKLDYSYHYQKGNALIFRYDNTPHYPLIATFPHHKHEGPDEKNVLASKEPAFENILQEILHLLSS